MLNLGAIGFISPWILSALLVLPLLWWLLRITPPAPHRIAFPAIRLLFGLRMPEETAASSPWWLVLLRLLAAALLILALSHPLLAPNKMLGGQGPLILLVDNGWASALNWPARQEALRQYIDQAEREDRPVILLATAAAANGRAPEASSQLRPVDARLLAGAMTPNPWPTNHAAALDAIRALKIEGPASTIWLSDGLGDVFIAPLTELLQHHGETRILTPKPTDLPHVLGKPETSGAQLTVVVRRATAVKDDKPTHLRALAQDGRQLAYEPVIFKAGAKESIVAINLPLELRNEITRLELEYHPTAASVFLTDEQWRRRPVGVVSTQRAGNSPSLLSEIYYLQRGLAPFNEVTTGALETLLDRSLAVIAIPDAATIDATQEDALRQWAKAGG
ncbi:MAG: BatA domain-containing protein, partial [Alphaproteobacteria bacterium]|nr:BatA domain-containing protein [Alphaproteobacteria bacterium]